VTETRPSFRVLGIAARGETHFRLALGGQIDAPHFSPALVVGLPIIAPGFIPGDNQSEPYTFGIVLGFTGDVSDCILFLHNPQPYLFAHLLLQAANVVVIIVVPIEPDGCTKEQYPAHGQDRAGEGFRSRRSVA
jgi:hypothetical protein